LFLPVLEARKWKSIVPASFEDLLAVLHMMVVTDALHRHKSVKWQAGLHYNGGKDFAISLVGPNAAEGIGN
uniref:Uncharacterized protein n=1 Tax=Saimiri boliviensis boliviensis TaxID=39432 RepID=A0A2K6UX13_SAIBB